MNKPLLSSGLASRVLRTGATLFALLFVFGVGSTMAQADVLTTSTLTGSQNAVKNIGPSSTNAVFVTNAEAMTLIKAEVASLQSSAPSSAADEAASGAQGSYYMAVLEGLRQGGNISDIYDSSTNQLYRIIAQYDLANRPDFSTIRQNLFNLVTQ